MENVRARQSVDWIVALISPCCWSWKEEGGLAAKGTVAGVLVD